MAYRVPRDAMERLNLRSRSSGTSFYISRIDTCDQTNKTKHRTDQFNSKALILRRGDEFQLDVHLNIQNSSRDIPKFYLELKTGSEPQLFDNTLVNIQFVDYLNARRWGMKRTESLPYKFQLRINIPPNCLVAKYQMRILSQGHQVWYSHKEPIFILFNPWCRDDEVYMPNTLDLEEYILNDKGVLFQGSADRISPLEWHFGQFEDVALESVFYLLNATEVHKRVTAVDICRRISALVNSNDDDGVIVGNWGDDFSDGALPWSWTGSTEILAQFMETKRPVKYGQCWCFAGVVTTLLRALGIPSRAITNFKSFHDINGNGTYDIYFNSDGVLVKSETEWNYHCWNDAWMARLDLRTGYGGWQAVDATPQEISKGLYQLGPAPLIAIKEGYVNIEYDVRFVFAEVNADIVYWRKVGGSNQYKPFLSDSTSIGQKISTKAVGKNNNGRMDITNDYKYPEGTALERVTVRHALKLSRNEIVENMPTDLEFEQFSDASVTVGEDILIRLRITNTSRRYLSVNIMIGGNIVMYNGVALQKIQARNDIVAINRLSASTHEMRFLATHYLMFLHRAPSIRFYAFCSCVETGQTYVTEFVVTLNRPELVFENFPPIGFKGKEIHFFIRVKNPLSIPLMDCLLRLDGNMMQDRIKISQSYVQANGTVQIPVTLIPEYPGQRHIVASFTTTQLSGFRGSKDIVIL